MVKDPFDVALAEFERWTATTQRKLSADPVGELETLLPLMRGYLDIEGPGDLGAGDLDLLLLRIYPRKVAVLDPADTEPTIPAVRDFLAFLTERGDLPEDTARALDRELDLIAPRFTDMVMDPSNWGTASSLMHEMAADGIDLDDQAGVDRWMNDFNEGLTWSGDAEDEDDEPVDLKEAFGLPDEMPPLRLPAVPELAAMARQARLMGQLRRLAWWLGAGRAVNDVEELSDDDAAQAAAELGVNLQRLEYLWPLALDAEFVELDEDETHAVPGEIAHAWDQGDDDEVLDIWETVFALVIGTTLDVAADLDPERSEDLDFSGHGAVLAVMLFLARPDGLTVAEVSEAVRGDATAGLPPAEAEKAWQSWVRAHDDPARLLVGQMAELGAIQIADAEDGPLIRLMPLGLDAIRTQLVGSGVDIPLLPPPEQMTAAQLIAMADGASEEEFTAETTAWLSHRTAESAARELLAAAAAADPASRILAVGVVITDLGALAEPVWRDVLGQAELSGYAKAALTMLSGGDPAVPLPGLEPDGRDLAWMITDTLAAEGWDDPGDDVGREPEALAKQLAEAIPAGQEMAMFELMARLPHPDAAAVLTVIGKCHPDKKIAKLARKSAYKAATRQASQPR
ncbi:MAG TPA: hypothetical protein VMK84_31580 [Streptosporangiaceae bacterium]|nr:hypothetical protein [Streptosporangiaceae bacterium]